MVNNLHENSHLINIIHSNRQSVGIIRYKKNKNTENFILLIFGIIILGIFYIISNKYNKDIYNEKIKKLEINNSFEIPNNSLNAVINLDLKYYDYSYIRYCYYTDYQYVQCAYDSNLVKFSSPSNGNESRVLFNINIKYKVIENNNYVFKYINKDIIINLNKSINYTSDFIKPDVYILYNKTLKQIAITNGTNKKKYPLFICIILVILIMI